MTLPRWLLGLLVVGVIAGSVASGTAYSPLSRLSKHLDGATEKIIRYCTAQSNPASCMDGATAFARILNTGTATP